MIKNWLVSRALPGPINCSHHPDDWLRSVEAAWEEAERPVCRRMTLSFAGERVPQVSYAMSNSGREAVYTRERGEEWWYFL
jgi:hypothetical protein